MARIEWVEARLREWGEWARSEGRSELAGYPTKNCLHADWGRPGSGAVLQLRVGTPGRGLFTQCQLRALSRTLQETLTRHYAANQPVAVIAEAMATTPATVDQRIWRAHAVLAHML